MADLTTALPLGDVMEHLNVDWSDATAAVELERFVAAADRHVVDSFGPLLNVARVEQVTTYDGRLWLRHWPVLSVTSVAGGTNTFTTGLVVSAAGEVTHASLYAGTWTVTYTSGWVALPDDLKLAVMEDIRGLYQRGQLATPGAIGAFGGGEVTDAGTVSPITMWPRTDEWINRRAGGWVG